MVKMFYLLSVITFVICQDAPSIESIDPAFGEVGSEIIITGSNFSPNDEDNNLQGREVSTLISGKMEAGYHSVVWNADAHASGVYFVKMVAGEYISTQKLMLVK